MVSFFLPVTICNKWLHTPPCFNSSAHSSISFLRLSPFSLFPAASCKEACSKYRTKTISEYGFSRSVGGRVLRHSTSCRPWPIQKSFRVAIQLVHESQMIRHKSCLNFDKTGLPQSSPIAESLSHFSHGF